MIVKGFTMIKNDRKIATFRSLIFVQSAIADMRGVDVSNWQCDIDTNAHSSVLINDAIELANTPLIDRD